MTQNNCSLTLLHLSIYPLILGSLNLSNTSVYAQINPDNTLGAESSVVTPNATVQGQNADLIQGGATRGGNLFHSFQDFNVGELQRVYFANPDGIGNILSRVTGGNLSQILGTLGVDGAANLFLINPNGIIFGENAVIDVRGSFTATSADGILLGENGFFSATNPDGSTLIDVAPSALFYNQLRTFTGAIENSGRLTVANGQNLTLSGDIVINSGTLEAPGGIVALFGNEVNLINNAVIDVSSNTGGGIALIGGDYQGTGTGLIAQQTFVGSNVEIKADALQTGDGGKVIVWADDTTHFYGNISARGGDISGDGGFVEVSGKNNLTFNGLVDTSAVNGNFGTLLLDPTNIFVVAAGEEDTNDLDDVNDPNDPDLDPTNQRTSISNTAINNANADVTLAATNDINFEAPVNITAQGVGLTADAGGDINVVDEDITTNGGDILLDAERNINVSNAELNSSSTITNTQAGDITLRAKQENINITGSDITASANNNSSGFPTIKIDAENGSVSIDQSEINAKNDGSGFAGDIAIGALESLKIDASSLLADGDSGRIGIGADMTDPTGEMIITDVQTPSLVTLEGSTITTNDDIDAGGIGIGATQTIDINNSTVSANGSSGEMAIGVNVLRNDNSIFIQVQTPSAIKIQDSQITTTNEGSTDNNAGNISITALNNIEIKETDDDPNTNKTLVSSRASGMGKAGNITITAGSFDLLNGADLQSSTFGTGIAGNITITATRQVNNDTGDVINSGAVTLSGDNTIIASNLREEAKTTEKSLGININAESLTVEKGAQIQTRVLGEGDAGDIMIDVQDDVVFSGINSQATVSSNASSIVEEDAKGKGGNILLEAESLTVEKGAQILTSVRGEGDAGDITINVQDDVVFSNTDSSDEFTTLASSRVLEMGMDATGKAGNIKIEAGMLSLLDGAQLLSSNSGTGTAGTIIINNNGNAANKVEVRGENSSIISSARGTGNSNNIDINARQVIVDGASARISTTNKSGTFPGTITIKGLETNQNNLPDAEFSSLDVSGGGRITTSTETGRAGNVFINQDEEAAASGNLNNGTIEAAATLNDGRAGSILLNAKEVTITENSRISAQNIDDTITESNVSLTGITNLTVENSEIVASTESGTAGNITVNASESVTIDGQGTFIREEGDNTPAIRGGIFAEATTTGQPGNITLGSTANTISELVIQNGAEISTAAKDIGDNDTVGNIAVTANNVTLNSGGKIDSRTDGTRDAGNISITANNELKITTDGSIRAESTASDDSIPNINAGNAGNISVTAETIDIDQGRISSEAEDDQAASGIIQLLSATGAGEAIVIKNNSTIEANSNNSDPNNNIGIVAIAAGNGSVNISDSQVTAENLGSAVSGGIGITSRETVNIKNTPISSNGNSGIVLIGADNGSVNISDSQVTTDSLGFGKPGVIRISANQETVNITNSTISSNGEEGFIQIVADNNSVNISDSQVTTENSGSGDAGIIYIGAKETVSIKNNSTISSDGEFGIINIGGNKEAEIVVPSNIVIEDSQIRTTNELLNRNPNRQGDLEGRAGNIEINAQGDIKISGVHSKSGISISTNTTFDGAEAGDIRIGSNNLTVDNAKIQSNSPIPSGDAGNILLSIDNKLSAENSEISTNTMGRFGGVIVIAKDVDSEFSSSDAQDKLEPTSTVEINGGSISATTTGSGNAGLIRIESGDLIVGNQDEQNDRIRIESRSESIEEDAGNAGNIILNAEDNISLNNVTISSESEGSGDSGFIRLTAINEAKGNVTLNNTTLSSQANGTGKGGNIDLTVNNLTVEKSRITASTEFGIAGDINISASESVTLDDQGIFTRNNGTEEKSGGLISGGRETGQPGKIEIATGDLVVKNDAEISARAKDAETEEERNISGNINIVANNVTLKDGGKIDTTTDGNRNAGAISINQGEGVNAAEKVQVTGKNSSIASQATRTGNSNNININARQVIVHGENARISTRNQSGTFPGTVTIRGLETNQNNLPDGKFSLEVSGGGIISTSTGSGRAGDVLINRINPQEDPLPASINLAGGTIEAAANDKDGEAGSITIDAGILTLEENSQLSTSNVDDNRPNQEGNLRNINLTVDNLTVEKSRITAESTESGIAGDINISAGESIRIDGQGTFTKDDGTTEKEGGLFARGGETGQPGNIKIGVPENRSELLIRNAEISTIAGDTGNNQEIGSIVINAKNVTLESAGKIDSSTTGNRSAGFIDITANNLSVSDGSIIESESGDAGDAGDAGDILLSIDNNLTLSGADSQISTKTINGDGGAVIIAQDTEPAREALRVDPDIEEPLQALVITDLDPTPNVKINDGEISASTTGGGFGGLVKIETNNLTVNNGKITSDSDGSGAAFGIFLDVKEQFTLSGTDSQISSTSTEDGDSGTILIGKNTEFRDLSIDLEATSIVKIDGGSISTTTERSGNAGRIKIETNILDVNNGRITSNSNGSGDAGDAGGIFLDVKEQFTVSGTDSQINSSTNDGNGGAIFIAKDTESALEAINEEFNEEFDEEFGLFEPGVTAELEPIPTVDINGGQISANTTGSGAGGLINITTNNLTIKDEGTIQSTATSDGDGGSIFLEIVDDEEIDNPDKGNLIIIGTGIKDDDNPTGIVADASGTGTGGTIIIAKDINNELISAIQGIDITKSIDEINDGVDNLVAPPVDRISIKNGGTISANTKVRDTNLTQINEATGNIRAGGNIFISAVELSQTNNSDITAGIPEDDLESVEDESGIIEKIQSGNIVVRVLGTDTAGDNRGETRELVDNDNPEATILLQEKSDILTIGGKGGLIITDSRFIIGSRNSDLVAGAEGIISVETELVFGLQERDRRTPLNDVNGGVISIVGFDIDNQLVPELSQEVVDVSSLIDRRCDISSGDNVSSFTIIGDGGLPPNLDKFLSIPGILPDFGTDELEIESEEDQSQTITPLFSFAKSNLEAEVAAYSTTWKFPQNCFAASVDK